MECNLIEWSGHNFLTGQVTVSSHTHTYNFFFFFCKSFIFVLRNFCPCFRASRLTHLWTNHLQESNYPVFHLYLAFSHFHVIFLTYPPYFQMHKNDLQNYSLKHVRSCVQSIVTSLAESNRNMFYWFGPSLCQIRKKFSRKQTEITFCSLLSSIV